MSDADGIDFSTGGEIANAVPADEPAAAKRSRTVRATRDRGPSIDNTRKSDGFGVGSLDALGGGRLNSKGDFGLYDFADKVCGALNDSFQPVVSLAHDTGSTIVGSFSQGISAAVQSGSIGEGFRVMGATLISGLGRMVWISGRSRC